MSNLIGPFPGPAAPWPERPGAPLRRWVLPLLALLGLSLATAARGAEDVLPPEQAFRLHTQPTDSGVRFEWRIADGYYLYRDKFRFRSRDPQVTLGAPAVPAGTPKEDPFFGRLETHRGTVAVDVPVQRVAGLDRVTIEATSQGCADLGICYPPQTVAVSVALPPMAAPPASASAGAAAAPPASPLRALASLGQTLGLQDAGGDFLEPDQAFRHSAEARPDGTVVARWEIADGYYLYRDKLRLEVRDAPGVTLGAPSYPAGKMKDDPGFGKVEVYFHSVELQAPVTAAAPGARFELEVAYQGCAEAGICYPPMKKRTALVIPAAFSPAGAGQGGALPPAVAEPVSEQDRLAARLASDSALVTALWFFGFGLLLAFTPCVFPMIPILSGIIVGQGSSITTRRAFALSVVYVLAMSVTYTVAGVIAGLFGANLQAALQNPWVLSSFAAVFVLLALSMFGFYDLQMPSSWQSRLSDLSSRQRGGTLIGVAVMGLLSALIVGPCVAPPLAGALIYIGQTGDPWLGGTALFALSLGMGAPLVVVGTLEGRYLPRAGGWMNAVKAVFGVALLGVAVFLLERVLPAWIALLLWAALFIVSAIYLGALEPLGLDASGFRRLWKGLGLVMLVYGVLLMIGAASGGGGGVLQPLRGVAVASAGATPGLAAHALERVKGMAELEARIAEARAAGKPVMLDFYADWCIACKELEAFTFSDPGVRQTLARAVLLQSDVTENDAQDQAMLKHFGLIGPPAVLFFGPDGGERRGYRLVGFVPAEAFRAHAEKALR
jgi:thiol:disulfide interchange protein DsbD